MRFALRRVSVWQVVNNEKHFSQIYRILSFVARYKCVAVVDVANGDAFCLRVYFCRAHFECVARCRHLLSSNCSLTLSTRCPFHPFNLVNGDKCKTRICLNLAKSMYEGSGRTGEFNQLKRELEDIQNGPNTAPVTTQSDGKQF